MARPARSDPAARPERRWSSADLGKHLRLTPNSEFFTVKHYNQPALSPLDWRLDVAGLVANPRTLSLADLQALPRRTVEFTLECSGNTGPPFFTAGWGRDAMALRLDDRTDWAEVAELLTESYCTLAPQKLQALVNRPEP